MLLQPKKGEIPMSHAKAFVVVSEAANNPLFTVRLNCFMSVAKVIMPFLVQDQSNCQLGSCNEVKLLHYST